MRFLLAALTALVLFATPVVAEISASFSGRVTPLEGIVTLMPHAGHAAKCEVKTDEQAEDGSQRSTTFGIESVLYTVGTSLSLSMTAIFLNGDCKMKFLGEFGRDGKLQSFNAIAGLLFGQRNNNSRFLTVLD